jgi:hypothetical protein
MRNRIRKKTQAGNNLVEFALVAMPLVILLLGITTTGLKLARSVQVSQVCRDAASMFVRGVDFSYPGNQDILVELAQGLGLTRTGGPGAVILSKVTYISSTKCTAMGNPPGCNANKHVITQRVVIGNSSNSSLRSNLGTPSSSLLDSKGIVNNYQTDDSAIATFPMTNLEDDQWAYVAEARFPGLFGGGQVYSRAIF